MRVVTLVRNEWIKTTRRFAFWVSLLTFSGIMAIQFGEQWWRARGSTRLTFAFPDAWQAITNDTTIVTAIFLVIVLSMLIGGEYAWKTARQNVIDGLSKNEVYLAKILTWVGAVMVFGVMQILVGGAFAAVSTPRDAGAWMHATDLAQVGGAALCLVAFTSLGFFFAFVSRNAAAGIGLFFLYVAFGEKLIGMIAGLFGDGAKVVTRYLPLGLGQRALATWQWDPAVLADVTKEAVASGGKGPVVMTPPALVAWILGWVVLVVGVAYLVFRARDL
jgi:ABC-2 type transport system permease protein